MPLEITEENSLPFHLALSKEIIAYTQHAIRIGTTELSFNEVKDKRIRKELKANIKRMRRLYHTSDPFSLEVDQALKRFERKVSMILTWHIGNCMEHSYLALDYLMNMTQTTRGEIFRIEGGDHAFLVIGRQRISQMDDPLTWGETAVICDPWAKKAYPARDYCHELRNYRYVFGVNRTEAFDPARHQILLRTITQTSDYLRHQYKFKISGCSLYAYKGKKLHYVEMVLDLFQEKMCYLKKACDEFCGDLKKIRDEIGGKTEESTTKFDVLSNCIKDLEHCSTQITNQLSQMDVLKTISAEEAANELSKQLRSNYQLFKEARDRLDEKKLALNEGRQFRFFNTKLYQKTVNALGKSHKRTSDYDKAVQNKDMGDKYNIAVPG